MSSSANHETRICQVCGQPMESNAAKNARNCTREDCKKKRWRDAAKKTVDAKKAKDTSKAVPFLVD